MSYFTMPLQVSCTWMVTAISLVCSSDSGPSPPPPPPPPRIWQSLPPLPIATYATKNSRPYGQKLWQVCKQGEHG